MAPPGGSGAITLGVPLVDSKAPAPSGAFCRLVLQRKRADCGVASPVIAALGGQNANRQSEQERGGDSDYAFGHHRSLLGFYVTFQPIAVYSTAACEAPSQILRIRKGNWVSHFRAPQHP